MQSMHILTQGGGGNTYMDLLGRGSRGTRELALVRMVCTTDHTISQVWSTYFVLRVAEVCEVCLF